MMKPKCKLTGRDGNVFVLAGAVTRALQNAGQPDQAKEFSKKLSQCESYGDALALMSKYVDVS